MDTQSLHKQLCATTGTSSALPLRQVVIKGPDAQEFLQGQFTLDLAQLPTEQHQMTAWCSAKGRVWCLLRIWRENDGFALLLPDNQAEAFIKRLRMFVLRAKVTVEASEQTICAQISEDGSGTKGQLEHNDQRTVLHHDPQHRLIIHSAEDASATESSSDIASRYTALRILAGEAQIDAETQEKFLPQSVGVGELGGLHFNKGCYVGQEIVARVHYRGKAPQKLNCGLDLSTEEQQGKPILAEVTTPAGQLLQWVENIKAK